MIMGLALIVYSLAEKRLREALERKRNNTRSEEKANEENNDKTYLSGIRGYYRPLQGVGDGAGLELKTDPREDPCIARS